MRTMLKMLNSSSNKDSDIIIMILVMRGMARIRKRSRKKIIKEWMAINWRNFSNLIKIL